MLWGKWFSTCQSEEKDKRWEKREVRDRERENDGGFQGNNEGSRSSKKKGRGKETKKFKVGKDKQRVALKENLQFSSGSSHCSSSCEQFSPGNDSFYFCGVVCLTPAHRNCAWPSGPASTPSLITRVTITTDEANLHRWQHRDVNFASASSTLAVWLLHLRHIYTNPLWKNKRKSQQYYVVSFVRYGCLASQSVIVQRWMICLGRENKASCQE